MKITDLLEEKSIRLNAAASSKKEALNQIINLINQTGNITNKEEYKLYSEEKNKEQRELEKELQYHMENQAK